MVSHASMKMEQILEIPGWMFQITIIDFVLPQLLALLSHNLKEEVLNFNCQSQ